MVKYGSSGAGYAVVGYGSSDSGSYSVTTSSWKKSTCCGSFKFGQRCSDCPGND